MDAFFRTLPGVFEAIDASDEVRDAFVFAAWRRVAGGQITERTALSGFEDRRLVIAVPDITWKRNLESLASQLVFRLNASFGKPTVDFIEFRVSPSEIPAKTENRREDDVDAVSLPPEIAVSASAIGDEKLRRTVLRAAANCLSRVQ